jgi:hypothetical protein
LDATRAAALPMAASVVLLFSEFWDPLRFTIPYILMAVILALAWLMMKSWSEIHDKNLDSV